MDVKAKTPSGPILNSKNVEHGPKMSKKETCAICGCALSRKAGTYATPDVAGWSHATRHHFVAERFFGRSGNRKNSKREPIFKTCPWNAEHESGLFCYECHEELLHNPVLLKQDIQQFSHLVAARGLAEERKSGNRDLLGQRIRLFHAVIVAGLAALEHTQKNTERNNNA